MNWYARTELLLGEEAIERLKNARVAIFGVGGVGGYTMEALARSGVGILDLIDDDNVALTNLNRQIIATVHTVGKPKVEVAAQRVKDINPEAVVNIHPTFYTPETADRFDFRDFDYVVDAIDTVAGKLSLAVECAKVGTPLISAMGAGNKLDPTRFEVADISKTSVCPLARVMRKELKKRGISHLKVVYSKEDPIAPLGDVSEEMRPGSSRRSLPGSCSFVPGVAGLILAGEVIKDLAFSNPKEEKQ